jgi:hypothetical protein
MISLSQMRSVPRLRLAASEEWAKVFLSRRKKGQVKAKARKAWRAQR